MWKNIFEWSRPQTTIGLIRFACWIPKATNTHSQACPLQKWFHERASMLRYTYSMLPVLFSVKTDCPAEPDSNIAIVGKSVSAYVVSTNIAGIGTTYNVTSGDDSIKIVISLRNYCGGTQEKELLLKHAVKGKIRFGRRY